MDFHHWLRSRRSIRKFSGRRVSPDRLKRIIETAFYAPSAHNSQPWRFAVLSSPSSKNRLAEKMAEAFERDLSKDGLPALEIKHRLDRSRKRIEDAPAVIIVCLDESSLDHYDDHRRQEAELIMGIQSTAMAGLQLLLAASAEDLGGVWTCGPLFAPDAARSAFHLPESWKPQGMILLGYPGETPRAKDIRPFHEVVKFIDEMAAKE